MTRSRRGPNNDGNTIDNWGQGSANTSLSQTASDGYDSLNRLTSAAAAGGVTYDLAFGYANGGSNGQ